MFVCAVDELVLMIFVYTYVVQSILDEHKDKLLKQQQI